MTSPLSFSDFSKKKHEKLPPLNQQTVIKNNSATDVQYDRSYESKLCASFVKLHLGKTTPTSRIPSSSPSPSHNNQRLRESLSLPVLSSLAQQNPQSSSNPSLQSSPKYSIKNCKLKLQCFGFLQMQQIASYSSLETLFIQAKHIEERAFIDFGQFKKLKSITISSTPLRASTLAIILKCVTLTELILVNCHLLENIADNGLENLKNLKLLKIINCSSLRPLDYTKLFTSAPKLTSFEVENAVLDDLFFENSKHHFNRIENCSLNKAIGHTHKGLQILLSNLYSVKTLKLSHLPLLNETACSDLQSCLPQLKELRVESCHALTTYTLFKLLFRTTIHTLTLSNCSSVNDTTVHYVARLKTLTSLDLTACQKITNDAIISFFEMRALTRLTFSHTRKITSAKITKLYRILISAYIRVIPRTKFEELCVKIDKKKELFLKKLNEDYKWPLFRFESSLPTIKEII